MHRWKRAIAYYARGLALRMMCSGGLSFVGVWGSYKTHTLICALRAPRFANDSVLGYMDSPKLILWGSIPLKLTNTA